jgi:hypothetical protein
VNQGFVSFSLISTFVGKLHHYDGSKVAPGTSNVLSEIFEQTSAEKQDRIEFEEFEKVMMHWFL